jgi:organic radical activating enzyme|tara:strand:- start:27972 stop:29360 length:1389 start_codon:yes stop_codon:yes gene_type:complete
MSETNLIRQNNFLMDKISPTFCLAKWHHTTIYLHTGDTHSCYHPSPHKISLNEIKKNPSALHNTLQKKKERAQMLVGVKCEGCQYCWNVEELGDDHISDRMIRNQSIYKKDRVDEILKNNWDFDINPEYIEISFSNECNFKCGYCHPMASSSYYAEVEKYGPVKQVSNHRVNVDWFTPIDEKDNPYVDAWWKWWPEVSQTLNILRITGGEPLLHRSTWQILDDLLINKKPHLELNINSNLGVTHRLVKKLAQKVNLLEDKKSVRKFKLYTSIDTYNDRAEYLRTGLQIELWEKNLTYFLESTNGNVSIMCTFNILSVTSFILFLQKILDLRKKFYNSKARRIRFDTPYLKEPLQYDMNILPKDQFSKYFDNILNFIHKNCDDKDTTLFSSLEYERFRRVKNYFLQSNYDEDKILEGRKDFFYWFTEYDKRRNTNFLHTFPEMKDFWDLCAKSRDIYNDKMGI